MHIGYSKGTWVMFLENGEPPMRFDSIVSIEAFCEARWPHEYGPKNQRAERESIRDDNVRWFNSWPKFNRRKR
jgi:hypothetical protein